jgi:aminoglycoside phosphotransferase (APT) family kinase protein
MMGQHIPNPAIASGEGLPPADVIIDVDLAERLLREQAPHLAGERPLPLGEGWDNATFRLGADLALRLPRRHVAADLILNEQRWLPALAPSLPIAVPILVHAGSSGSGFPWAWSVVRWVEGEPADQVGFPEEHAALLATLLKALHQPVPEDAPRNPYRGVPLAQRAEILGRRLDRLGRLRPTLTARLRDIWQSALAAAPAVGNLWIHGDLHPANLIVRDGALAGIIDWGDLTAGDPATDLAAAWLLFDSPDARSTFFATYGAGFGLRRRAAGWAILFATAVLESRDPRHAPTAEAALRRLTRS